MKRVLLCLITVLILSGCTTLQDGTKVPDTSLIRDLTTVSTSVIVGEIKKRGLDTQEVLKHIHNAQQLVKETPDGVLVDLGAVDSYLEKYVPYEYQAVARLVVKLIKNRVEPIIQSEIDESEKAQLVMDVIVAILDGVEAGVLVYDSSQI